MPKKRSPKIKITSSHRYLWGGILFACLMAVAGGVYLVLQSRAATNPFYVNDGIFTKSSSGQYQAVGRQTYYAGQSLELYPYLAVTKSHTYGGEQLLYAFTYDASRVELLSSSCLTPWSCYQSTFTGPLMHPNGINTIAGVHTSRAVYCFDSFPSSPNYYPLKIAVKFKVNVSDVYWFSAWHGSAPSGCASNRAASQAIWNGGRGSCGATSSGQNGSTFTEPPCYSGPNPGAGSFIGFSGGSAPAASGGGAGSPATGQSPLPQAGPGMGSVPVVDDGNGQAVTSSSNNSGSNSQMPHSSSTVTSKQPNPLPQSGAIGAQQEPPKIVPSPFYDGKEYERGSDKDTSPIIIGENGKNAWVIIIFTSLVVALMAGLLIVRHQKRKR